MKTHEYQAKEIFSKYGIPVERHTLCRTAAGVVAAFRTIGTDRVVIKAQVLTGGRGKAGGVKVVDNMEDAYQEAKNILGMSIKGLPVNQVLVSEAIDIAAEYYVGFTIDRNTRSVVLMLSASGGMDIEEVARRTPEKIIRYSIDPFIGLPDYLARRFAFSLFPQMEQAGRMAVILQELYKVFIENDASLVEVNPLALTAKGTLIAIDAKIVFDDNALYRHPGIQALFDPTEEEKVEANAKDKGFSYVHMDGNIGCMVNGAGLAMATMDMIKLHGGNPANFLDIGGSSNPLKVVEAMKLLLQDEKVKVVLINIFGGITRCDDVALGLIQAFDMIKSDIPVIVRLTGTNENIGRELLRNHSRFQIATTMKEAALMALKS
ncbi:ADP-forming succinate--CoA ligase subunit beta [Bacteroides sp. GM023]|uniref:ADP-forming succinate--CoA ligase subunit beta n=1 Tax=Bacteroides sp. GM023 TaxID=2723058 RepID=UPI00168AEAA5|nr:ADP-forming succinate--CoA ligase subunit beta [Bacteroides sp. GM023]MBD3589476.1 ADP-forming succinate--CoA ligase subunit beta [Bacteroides sp. GM023]